MRSVMNGRFLPPTAAAVLFGAVRRLFGIDGNARLDQGSPYRRLADIKAAFEFAHPLAHAEEAEAIPEIGRKADAVVGDPKAEFGFP